METGTPYRPMDPQELHDILREKHDCLTARQRAAVCGVDLRTMQRWDRGHSPIPRTVAHLVRLLRRVQPPEGVEARHLFEPAR